MANQQLRLQKTEVRVLQVIYDWEHEVYERIRSNTARGHTINYFGHDTAVPWYLINASLGGPEPEILVPDTDQALANLQKLELIELSSLQFVGGKWRLPDGCIIEVTVKRRKVGSVEWVDVQVFLNGKLLASENQAVESCTESNAYTLTKDGLAALRKWTADQQEEGIRVLADGIERHRKAGTIRKLKPPDDWASLDPSRTDGSVMTVFAAGQTGEATGKRLTGLADAGYCGYEQCLEILADAGLPKDRPFLHRVIDEGVQRTYLVHEPPVVGVRPQAIVRSAPARPQVQRLRWIHTVPKWILSQAWLLFLLVLAGVLAAVIAYILVDRYVQRDRDTGELPAGAAVSTPAVSAPTTSSPASQR